MGAVGSLRPTEPLILRVLAYLSTVDLGLTAIVFTLVLWISLKTYQSNHHELLLFVPHRKNGQNQDASLRERFYA